MTTTAAGRLAHSLSIRTVDGAPDSVFSGFQDFLVQTFPGVSASARIERPNPYAMLIAIPGSDAGLKPAVFLAHYDVVDAPDTEQWTHPPFDGVVQDGIVWGRGALDDKGILMALLEAMEILISEGFAPKRTCLFAFGGDEETAGEKGAGTLAQILQERKVQAEFVFDEGAVVASGMVPFLKSSIALIGVAEKGVMDVRVTATGAGGHASMPPDVTPLDVLSQALIRIRKNPMPARITGTAHAFLKALGAHVPGVLGWILRHSRWTAPLIKRVFAGNAQTGALVRTTMAPTMAKGAQAPNVLPSSAELILNCRVLPGDSIQSVLSHLRTLLAGLPVTVELRGGDSPASDPVPETRTDTTMYRTVAEAAQEVFPDAVVAPFLVTVTTDSRTYTGIAENIYRLIPYELDSARVSTLHGVDERVTIEEYNRAIRFYRLVIQRTTG